MGVSFMEQKNGKAVASLVLGIISLVLMFIRRDSHQPGNFRQACIPSFRGG